MPLLLFCRLFLNIDTTYTTLFIGRCGGILYGIWWNQSGFVYATSTNEHYLLWVVCCWNYGGSSCCQASVGFGKAIAIAGKMGRTNAINFRFRLEQSVYGLERINWWIFLTTILFWYRSKSGGTLPNWRFGKSEPFRVVNEWAW